MKKIIYLLTVLAILNYSCSKDDDNTLSELPKMTDPNDVCTAMDDLNFMKYCYENFDVNKDGKVSINEANSVHDIQISEVKSLKGIQYFKNLIYLRTVKNSLLQLDVSHNLKLTKLSCLESKLTSLDISKNTNLENLICSDMELESLDVSNNIKLSHLYCLRCPLLSSIMMKREQYIKSIYKDTHTQIKYVD